MSKEIADNTASTPSGQVPEVEAELITDEQLAALFPEETPVTPPVEPPKVEPEAPVTSPETPEGLDEAQLDEWSKAEAAEPNVPAHDEYIQELTRVIPNRETASYAIEAFQKQHAFESALQAGNLDAAMEAMPSVKALVSRAIDNHLKVNGEKFVQEWIERNETEKSNPLIQSLKTEVEQLKAYLHNGAQQQNTQKQQAEFKARQEAIEAAIPTFLDSIRFTKDTEERALVADLFRVELSKDTKTLQKALAGDVQAIRPALSKAVKRFVALDKKRAAAAPPNKETPTPVITKGGIQTGEELDVWAQAENYMNAGR